MAVEVPVFTNLARGLTDWQKNNCSVQQLATNEYKITASNDGTFDIQDVSNNGNILMDYVHSARAGRIKIKISFWYLSNKPLKIYVSNGLYDELIEGNNPLPATSSYIYKEFIYWTKPEQVRLGWVFRVLNGVSNDYFQIKNFKFEVVQVNKFRQWWGFNVIDFETICPNDIEILNNYNVYIVDGFLTDYQVRLSPFQEFDIKATYENVPYNEFNELRRRVINNVSRMQPILWKTNLTQNLNYNFGKQPLIILRQNYTQPDDFISNLSLGSKKVIKFYNPAVPKDYHIFFGVVDRTTFNEDLIISSTKPLEFLLRPAEASIKYKIKTGNLVDFDFEAKEMLR